MEVANDEGLAKIRGNPHFFLDDGSLYANLVRVTIEDTGPHGGGARTGFPFFRSFAFFGGTPPFHHSIPPSIGIRQPAMTVKYNST